MSGFLWQVLLFVSSFIVEARQNVFLHLHPFCCFWISIWSGIVFLCTAHFLVHTLYHCAWFIYIKQIKSIQFLFLFFWKTTKSFIHLDLMPSFVALLNFLPEVFPPQFTAVIHVLSFQKQRKQHSPAVMLLQQLVRMTLHWNAANICHQAMYSLRAAVIYRESQVFLGKHIQHKHTWSPNIAE